MSEPVGISSGIAARYATAIFEIAHENNKLAELEGNIDDLGAALAESGDLRDLISNPIYSRENQKNGITAVAAKMKLRPVLRNALALMADKRRLFVLPQLLDQLRGLIAAHKGEVTGEVVSAKPLTDAQMQALSAQLQKSVGKEVKLNATVDESLIGGLVVKVGSKMIDTSIASRLNSLQNAMKEVG